MRSIGIIITLVLAFPAISLAGPSLREAFFAQVEIRKLEEKIALLELSEAAAWEKESRKQKLEAALTAARIHFHSFQLANSPDLSPAEALLLNRKQGKVPEGRNFKLSENYLEENFSDAASFSLMEWELLEDWFGKEATSLHLKAKFPARMAEKSFREPTEHQGEKITVIYVEDPFAQEKKAKKQNTPSSEETETILQLSQFPELEQQAEELKIRLERFQEPFFIVTKGRASATLQKLLDLQPHLRLDPRIRGWVNLDGVLSGKKLVEKTKGRGLASVKKQAFINPLEVKAQKALYLLRKEDLERQPGLGKGFPIVNLISESSYPKRDSIVSEGEIITFTQKGKAPIAEAVSLLENPGQ